MQYMNRKFLLMLLIVFISSIPIVYLKPSKQIESHDIIGEWILRRGETYGRANFYEDGSYSCQSEIYKWEGTWAFEDGSIQVKEKLIHHDDTINYSPYTIKVSRDGRGLYCSGVIKGRKK